MLLWSLSAFVFPVLGMGAVAFITLLERKILGLTQYRLGPNKASIYGLLQPVMDGVKLLTKAGFRPNTSQSRLFLISPMLLMASFSCLWTLLLPWWGTLFDLKTNSLLLFCCLAVMAYSVILAGWSSTSSFSKLGSLRGILQSLSYEVALILIFLWSLSGLNDFSFFSAKELSLELGGLWLVLILVLTLMEGNRAPFDLLEGESELISGFNIEMGSLMFVYLFLSEYGMILVASILIAKILTSSLSLCLSILLMALILTLRSCFPRIRYDSLMGLMWKSILPCSILLLTTSPLGKS